MKKTGYMLFLVILAGFLQACVKTDTGDPGSGTGGGTTNLDCSVVTNKSFSADVNPIIQTRCATANCHAAGSTNSPGPLTNYPEIFNARDKIRNVISLSTMPPGTPLTTAQRGYIICWIDMGAPYN